MKKGLSDLETLSSTIKPLNHDQVEWQRVRRTGYLIYQHLHYEYPGPIQDLNQRLMILPPEQYGNQHRVDYRLEVSTPTFDLSCRSDEFDNQETKLQIAQVEQAIDFEAWILVERSVENKPHYLSADWLTDARLLQPSALTQPDNRLRQIAATLLASGMQGLVLAEQINEWTHQALRYAHEVTNIHTTAAEALALGQGVCQDYAHIMIVLCRLCGLPARYVSGHMLGEGGTHAWVEVLLPVAERPELAIVEPFDPTNEKRVGLDYLTIAVGRDYYDVAPTSGTFRAAYRGQLTTRKRVNLTLLEYEDIEGIEVEEC
jgi:transglutaminase-like putative cysteine protease